MKKVLTVLVVLAVVCTSVFAADMSVRGHVSPLVFAGYEGVVTPLIGDGIFALNLDAQFNYYVTDNIRVGLKGDTLLVINSGSVTPWVLALYAKAGYVYPINDQWSVAADLGLGIDFGLGKAFSADLELTGAYHFNKNLSLDFGAQVSGDFMEGNAMFGFGPIVGVEYKF